MTASDDDGHNSVLPLTVDLPVPPLNSPLALYEGPAAVVADEAKVGGTLQVEISWSPVPSLTCRFRATMDEDLGGFRQQGSNHLLTLEVGGSRGQAALRSGQLHAGVQGTPWFTADLVDDVLIDYGLSAKELRFELVNLEAYHGVSVQYSEYSWRAGRLAMTSDKWIVDVDAVEYGRERELSLGREGGFAVTHVARAVKKDASDIAPADATALLTEIQYSLSLAAGRWVTPVRPRAFGESGKLAWEVWGLWYTKPWSSSISWAGHGSAADLSHLFCLIDNRWSDPYWEHLLRTAVHYYIDATHGLTHRQLIMGTSLLELIGWHVVVEDRQLLSPNGYDRLTTTDKLRLLMRLLCVSLDIPQELVALSAHAHHERWQDGAEAIAEARHHAVHAKRHRSAWEWGARVWADATILSAHYCDLAVLGLLGYEGRYVNRVTARYAADAGPMPWASAASSSPEIGQRPT